MDAYEAVKFAIGNKRIIRATYHGRERVMCPHVVGTKNGRSQALFYQFEGESTSGLDPDGSRGNWRCMLLDDLSDVSVEEGDWHTAPNHSREQTCVDEIDVEIEY